MAGKVLLRSNCSMYHLSTREELDTFTCGDKDLDDFFHHDALLYDEQLLGKTYFFSTAIDGVEKIICVVTLANDSIKAALLPHDVS